MWSNHQQDSMADSSVPSSASQMALSRDTLFKGLQDRNTGSTVIKPKQSRDSWRA